MYQLTMGGALFVFLWVMALMACKLNQQGHECKDDQHFTCDGACDCDGLNCGQYAKD